MPDRESRLIWLLLFALGGMYALLNFQVTRFELDMSSGLRQQQLSRATVEWPQRSLEGKMPVPWQYRVLVYPPLGLAIKAGVDAKAAHTAFKTITLILWLLALDFYLGVWFPRLSTRLVGILLVYVYAVYAIPWYVYCADDWLALSACTFFFGLLFRNDNRFAWSIVAALVAVLAKESMASLALAVVFWYRAHRELSIARLVVLICVFLIPAGVLYLAFPGDPSTTNLGIKLMVNLKDARNVNTIPVLVLFYFVFKNVRRDAFKRDLAVVLPWHIVYLLMLLVGGMTMEVRIWYPLLLLCVPCFLLWMSEREVNETR